jgi:hypothetical protein
MNLMIAYTHDPELQAITMLSLIYTLYKSQLHTLNLLQPFVAFPSLCLITALNIGDSSASVLTPLPAG